MDSTGWTEQAFQAINKQDYQYADYAISRAQEQAQNVLDASEIHFALGYLYFVQGELDQSLELLQDSLEEKEEVNVFDRQRMDIILLIGEVLRRKHRYDTARSWLDHARAILPHFTVLPKEYQGRIFRDMALSWKNEDRDKAKLEAQEALKFFPSDQLLLNLVEDRSWEQEAQQILQSKNIDKLKQAQWDGEGEIVQQYLLAKLQQDLDGIENVRKQLRDNWWRKDAWWDSAVLQKQSQPAKSLELLSQIEYEHVLSEEWTEKVDVLKAEILLELKPQELINLYDNSEEIPEYIKNLLAQAYQKTGDSISAAKLQREQGDWGAGARELLQHTYQELDQLVGLSGVKKTVKDWCDLVEVSRMRGEKPTAGHAVMTGNPGTGKTTVARIWGSLLWALDLRQENKITIVSRADLVGEYIGHTSPKVRKVWQEAEGGVLFIDEAYSLAGDDFGAEALTTLLELMENHREQVTVIMAGYQHHINELWKINPGLKSRFTRHLDFPDYSSQELTEIARRMFVSKNLRLEEATYQYICQSLDKVPRDQSWANAREVRNWIETLMVVQARRIIEEKSDPQIITTQDCFLAFQDWWKNRGV